MRFLFVDRIIELIPGQVVRGLKHVTREDYYLCPDEQGKFCFIPSFMGETLGQLAAWNVMASNDFLHRPVAGVVANARLLRPAYVGETLLLESWIDSLDEKAVQYHSTACIGEEVVFSLEGALGPLLPMKHFIDLETVRNQFEEINRPGEWSECTLAYTRKALPQALNLEIQAPKIPMLLFDHFLEIEPGVKLVAEKNITRAASYFADHFPNKPVLPLTVLLECKLNLAKEFVRQAGFSESYKVLEFRRIKMSGFVYPGDRIVTTVTVKSRDSNELILHYSTQVNGKRICVLDVLMINK